MHDFLTVTLNPTLDIATSVDKLVAHEKLRCERETEQVGGGGINVAQALQSLGADYLAMLATGGYRGREINQQLQSDGLRYQSISIEHNSRQCLTIYERVAGREYRFILPGPSLSDIDIDKIQAEILQQLPTKWLVLSGNLPPGVPEDFYAQIVKSARAQRPDLKFLVDVAGAPLNHALQAHVDVIKPSLKEFELLTEQLFKDSVDCATAARHFVSCGQASIVAVSLGAQGAVVVDKSESLAVKALPVEVISTVGAGDSFATGLVWALSQHRTLYQAVCIATATAASALQTRGKLRFSADEILAKSQQVSVRKLP